MFDIPKAKSSVPFSIAVEEFFQDMRAARRSHHTISDYGVTFRYFLDWLGEDLLMSAITKQHIAQFMQTMAERKTAPNGVAPRPARRRSAKTLRNYHTALSALWTWAVDEGYAPIHIIRLVKAPKVNAKPIEPFSDEEVVDLFNACKLTKSWHNKPLSQGERHTCLRDMAIILLLLETGVRRAELLSITMNDLDLSRNRIHIRHGKGDKDRYVSYGTVAAKALRHYLAERPGEAKKHGDYLFVNFLRYKGHKMSGGSLSKLLQRIGRRAGVSDVHAHRFRHTAAIKRLQNGMNAYQLKEFLGHADLASTTRYVNLAAVDMEPVWRRTSPVDNLRL